jgi:hypothetical protein
MTAGQSGERPTCHCPRLTFTRLPWITGKAVDDAKRSDAIVRTPDDAAE